MARNYNKMTEENIKDMYEMFDSGMSGPEIHELTGRTQSVINRYRKLWKKERRASNVTEIPKEPAVKAEEVKTGLENSDYAKSYLAGDPAVIRSSFEIERTVRIRSKKTGILYEMDCGESEAKVLKITLENGQTLNIELSKFEKFVDEGVDVFLEMKRTA